MGRLSRFMNLLFSFLAVALILAIAAGGYTFYRYKRAGDRDAAKRSLARATALCTRLQEERRAAPLAPELDRAEKALLDAQASFAQGKYGRSLEATEGAMALLRPIQGRLETPFESAKVLAGEGWYASPEGKGEALHEGDPVPEGRTVTAGPGGGMLVGLPDLEELELAPGGHFRLHSPQGKGDGEPPVLTLESGTVRIRCPLLIPEEGALLVRAAGLSIRPLPDSVILVGTAGGGVLEAQSGGVRVLRDGETEVVRAGIQGRRATLAGEGPIRPVPLVPPPRVSTPPDGKVYWLSKGKTVRAKLDWVPVSLSGTVVQVSRNPLFHPSLVASRAMTGTSTAVGGLAPGTYYWRLRASRSAHGRVFWSWPKRLRVVKVARDSEAPAEWVLKASATPVGDVVLVRGTVHPRLSVAINDVEVLVDDAGFFSGTVPLKRRAGAKIATVTAFDGEGRTKTWTPN